MRASLPPPRISVLPPGYDLVRGLGEGARSTVVLAREKGQREAPLVVIKRLRSYLTSDERVLERFRAQSARAAEVKHPNVVAIRRIGADDDGHYVVAEYVEGESLQALVERARRRGERLPVRVVGRVMLDALAGLSAGHGVGEGVVHRDVTPHNILVGRDGVARLTDFGKSAFEPDRCEVGPLLGKLLYLPPEHASSEGGDVRLDLFALGVSGWVALSGARPWFAGPAGEPLEGDDGLPPLGPVAPGVPEELERVILKACRRSPDERFGSAAEMAEAIERALAPVGGPASRREVGQAVEALLADDGRVTPVPGSIRPTSVSSPPPAAGLDPAGEPERSWFLEELWPRHGRNLAATLAAILLLLLAPTALRKNSAPPSPPRPAAAARAHASSRPELPAAVVVMPPARAATAAATTAASEAAVEAVMATDEATATATPSAARPAQRSAPAPSASSPAGATSRPR